MPYRRLPDIVEAFQLTLTAIADRTTWPQWLINAVNKPMDEVNSIYKVTVNNALRNKWFVETVNGPIEISLNDWIVMDRNGNLSIYSAAIFPVLYELIPISPQV